MKSRYMREQVYIVMKYKGNTLLPLAGPIPQVWHTCVWFKVCFPQQLFLDTFNALCMRYALKCVHICMKNVFDFIKIILPL